MEDKRVHEINIKKLWQGRYVSIRENHLLKGSYSGGLIVRHDRKKMFIPADICKRDFMQKKEKGTKVESKWGKPYYIIDFRWNPTEEEHRRGVLI